MSAIGDALVSLKNVVLLHERIEVLRKDVERLDTDVGGLAAFANAINVRVVRIETMIEMSARRGGSPALEGN